MKKKAKAKAKAKVARKRSRTKDLGEVAAKVNQNLKAFSSLQSYK
jgi:hypothetical protein